MIDEKLLLQSRPEALNDKMDMELQNQKGGYNNGWNDCLFYFIAGFFFGGIIEMVLYSVVVSVRINNLEYQNEQLMYELEQRNKDLLAYRCMYASAYDGFEETK